MPEDKTVLIKTAYSYYQKGDWDRAIEEYHKLAEMDPNDLNVHNMLADIYAKKGDVQEALQQYDLVAQGFDGKNQIEKVLQVYKRMLKLVPNDPGLLNAVQTLVDKYLSRASQLEEPDGEKAAEVYRSVLKADPTRVEAGLRYAGLLSKMGKKFEAIESLMNLASVLEPETQTGRLAEVLQAVTELDPLNIEAREKLADLFMKAQQTESAVKSLQDLIEIYISKSSFKEAEQAARRCIGLGDPNAYYHLGVIYFNQQNYQESRDAFVRFLEQQEAHVGALKYLALSCLRLNQVPEAVQAYLRILAVYFNENLLDEAREVRQTILELDPENQPVLEFALDPAPLAAETPAEPEAPAEEAADGTDPNAEAGEQQALMEQAQSFTEKGFYEQAIDVYLDMLKRWPDLPDIRFRLQQVYAMVAKSAEPAEKYPNPEEIKSELERELKEQMRRELEEQAKAAQERQRELDQKREMEQLRLKQELESRLLEQTHQNREEELRARLTREFEEKQRLLAMEKEKVEKERNESLDRMKAELEQTKSSLEVRIREQIEKEMKEKLEKENEREVQLKAALREEEERRDREEEQRKNYMAQKQEQEAVKAKINQEILQGMERLRLEKEKEKKDGKAGTAAAPPAAASRESRNPTVEKSAAPGGIGPQESLTDPFVRQTLADIYAKQGLYVEALRIYERILIEEPNNEDVREKLRNILRLKGI